MVRFAFIVLFTLTTARSAAQYFQYSQYNFATQRVNPAMAGLTRYATAGMLYRHQQTAGDVSINSALVSLSYPLLNSSTGVPWSGIAITLHNDQSAGIFKTQEASLGYAVHLRLSRYATLSFGAKALYQSRRIGMDGYFTGSQYVAGRGFDVTQSTGENFSELRNSFKTFSAGLYFQSVDKKGRVMNHFGVSLFDMNKPNDSFMGFNSQLPSTLIANAGIETWGQNGLHIIPEGLLTLSGNTAMFNGGIRLQKELNVKAKQPSDLVDVIVKYAVGRSGIVGFQLHREKISMGISYDFPLFRLNPANTGALEVGLELRRLVSTRAQKAIAKRKKAASEKQAALAKKNGTQPKTATQRTNQDQVLIKEQQPMETPIAPVTIDSAVTIVKNEISKGDSLVSNTTTSKDSTTLSALAKAGKIKQEPLVIERVTLHFAFEFNSSDLDEPTEKFLNDLSSTLKADPNLQLDIEGHTDNIGSDKFNLKLSVKRAEAVKAQLVRKGISAERLHTDGKGLREPLNGNDTEEDRARNRRVEITVYY